MAVVELGKYIKRYTKLEYAVDGFRRQKLVLPNPSKWDDLNDQEFVGLYRQYVSARSVYALCCTMGAERYHHWRIFAGDPTGICIEFKRAPFQNAMNRISGVRAAPVKYLTMEELAEPRAYDVEDLPFIKRIGFSDEREWRVLVTSKEPDSGFFEVPFRLDWVHRVVLNPWMTRDRRDAARRKLQPLLTKEIPIRSTFLTNSAKWKNLGKALVR